MGLNLTDVRMGWANTSPLAVTLATELLNAKEIVNMWSTQVRMSNLISTLKKLGSKEATSVKLVELKEDVDGAYKSLNMVVGQLDTMQRSMWRARDQEKKIVEKKIVKKKLVEKSPALTAVKLEQLGM